MIPISTLDMQVLIEGYGEAQDLLLEVFACLWGSDCVLAGYKMMMKNDGFVKRL